MKSKFLLLAAGTALALAAGTVAAKADIIPIPAGTIDPTDLHISGPGATGSDPVLLSNTTQFTVNSINATTTISKPIDVFFAVPTGLAAPTVTSVNGGATPFSPVVLTSFTLSAGQDLYTQVGCVPCNNSLSFTNFTTALASDITPPITGVTTFQIYELMINAALGPQSTDTVVGSFAAGTFLAPLGLNGTTVYDTSWTNTGLIDAAGVVPPTDVPEPATLALLGGALIGFGVKRRRRR